MENDILDSLNDLGYQGPLNDEVAFAKALEGGPKSLEYTKLVHILAEQLKKLCRLEEAVSIMNDPDESSSFLLELSSFLKELGCPYKCLVTGHMSSRLQSKEDRLLLLDYMVSELMAARMVQIDCPKEKQTSGMEIVMQESPTAKDLKEILIALKFNKPPPNITPEMLFSKLEAKLKDTLQKEGDKLVGKPLYNKALSEKEWKNLESTYSEMYEEYRLRRETLITRLECTIQSFEWSDRLKSKKDSIQSVYRPKREALKVKPDVKLSDFLAARTALLQVEKTSSANVRKNTQSDVNKVIIGQVPDRGGRPNEQQPPPPEMPSWQQRSAPQLPPIHSGMTSNPTGDQRPPTAEAKTQELPTFGQPGSEPAAAAPLEPDGANEGAKVDPSITDWMEAPDSEEAALSDYEFATSSDNDLELPGPVLDCTRKRLRLGARARAKIREEEALVAVLETLDKDPEPTLDLDVDSWPELPKNKKQRREEKRLKREAEKAAIEGAVILNSDIDPTNSISKLPDPAPKLTNPVQILANSSLKHTNSVQELANPILKPNNPVLKLEFPIANLEKPVQPLVVPKLTNNETVPEPCLTLPIKLSKKQRRRLRLEAEKAAKEGAVTPNSAINPANSVSNLVPKLENSRPNLINSIPKLMNSIPKLMNSIPRLMDVQVPCPKMTQLPYLPKPIQYPSKIPPLSTPALQYPGMVPQNMSKNKRRKLRKLTEKHGLNNPQYPIEHFGKPIADAEFAKDGNLTTRLTTNPQSAVLKGSNKTMLSTEIGITKGNDTAIVPAMTGVKQETNMTMVSTKATHFTDGIPRVLQPQLGVTKKDKAPTEKQIEKENETILPKTGHLPGVEGGEGSSRGTKRSQSFDQELSSKKIRLESPSVAEPHVNQEENKRSCIKNAKDHWVLISDKNGVPMDGNRAVILQKALEKAQYEQFESWKYSSNKMVPMFRYQAELKKGKLCLTPRGDVTFNWIIKTIETLHDLWEGCGGFKVTTVPICHIGFIFLPGFFQENPKKSRDFLAAMNPYMGIDKWTVYDHRVKRNDDGYDHSIVMSIPNTYFEVLRRLNFRLNYKLSSIRVNVTECTSYTEWDSEMLREYEALIKEGKIRENAAYDQGASGDQDMFGNFRAFGNRGVRGDHRAIGDTATKEQSKL